MSFKSVYELVVEHKIIQLENKWSPHKNAFFLSSIGKMLLVFVPDKPPQSNSDAGEGSGGKKKDANKHADQSRGVYVCDVCVCREKEKERQRILPGFCMTGF